MYSVVILTHNEEKTLPACLASLRGVAELIVVDSGSTDKTLDIARASGAKIAEHPFESFGAQRQWAMQHAANDWILFLDADERATPEFLKAVEITLAEKGSTHAAFDCCWRLILEGCWLRCCDGYPRYQTRLVHRGRVTWGDWGHGQKLASCVGPREKLTTPYNHEAYIHGWQNWWQKHQKYARQEAQARLNAAEGHDTTVKLKKILRGLPLWAEALFIYRYFFTLSCLLEGRQGYDYCVWRYRYERLISREYRQLKKLHRPTKA